MKLFGIANLIRAKCWTPGIGLLYTFIIVLETKSAFCAVFPVYQCRHSARGEVAGQLGIVVDSVAEEVDGFLATAVFQLWQLETATLLLQ